MTVLSASDGTFEQGLRAMQHQAGGGVLMSVVRPREAFRLERLAIVGDHAARSMLDIVVPIVKRAARGLQGAPMSCAACGRPIPAMKFSVVTVTPFLTWPANGLALPVCQRCGIEAAAIKGAATRACRAVWSGMAVIEATHNEGGRA